MTLVPLPPKMVAKIQEKEALIRDKLGDAFYERVTTVGGNYSDIRAVQDVLAQEVTE